MTTAAPIRPRRATVRRPGATRRTPAAARAGTARSRTAGTRAAAPADDTGSYGGPNGYGDPVDVYRPRPAPRAGYRAQDDHGDQDGPEGYAVDRYDGRYETGGYETGRWT